MLVLSVCPRHLMHACSFLTPTHTPTRFDLLSFRSSSSLVCSPLYYASGSSVKVTISTRLMTLLPTRKVRAPCGRSRAPSQVCAFAHRFLDLNSSLDQSGLGALVAEVVPEYSCLVFCGTKHECEVAAKHIASYLSKNKPAPSEELMAARQSIIQGTVLCDSSRD
jgi:hypothetical protein